MAVGRVWLKICGCRDLEGDMHSLVDPNFVHGQSLDLGQVHKKRVESGQKRQVIVSLQQSDQGGG